MRTSEDQGSKEQQQLWQVNLSSSGDDGEGNDLTLPSMVPLAAQALSAGSTPLLLASLVDLREVCRLSLLCRSTRQAYSRRSRKVCMTMGVGVPDDRRLEYWKVVLNVQKEMAVRNRGVSGDLYESCLYGDSSEGMGALLPPSGLRVLNRHGAEGEISRDVGRTFPSQPLFQSKNGPGQNMLANVLKAFLKINPDVGYCQGMNFLAGALLLACSTRDPAVAKRPQGVARDGGRTSEGGGLEYGVEGDLDAVVEVNLTMDRVPSWEESDDVDGSGEDERQVDWWSDPAHTRAEKDVFWLMMALTSRLTGVGSGLGMRELWLPGVPQLKVRVFQFDKLLLRELPRLYNHFRAKQLQLEVLVSQWFLTLFSYSLRPPMLLRVLDLTFTDGWKAMFRFGLARLRSVEDTLCELELEGVSRFLRGFRDSPPPSPVSASLPWFQRHFRGGSGNGLRKGPKNISRGNCSTGLSAASISVLRATGELKVTRSTLRCLQKDFAVQLLKEHLQGEGQWLTRYGSAPEPTPGAGAGVVGGAADGDVGFMGVEAMTRMMLSDTKLLEKLKDDLACMAAPLQADARVFQSKITEASERNESATKLTSSLTSELLTLSEDIDALKERKKLVAEQMHLLLVQFELDSAREEEEQQLDRQEEQELDSDSYSDRIHFAQDSNSTNGSKSRSNSLTSLSSVALSNGVRVSPSSSSGSASGGIGNESGNGWSGGGSLSFGAGASGSSRKGYVDDFGGRSGEEADAGGGGDGSDSLSWQAFSPPLPPPPSALADTAAVNGRRSLGEMEGTVEARPRDVIGDGAGEKTARSLTKRVSMISSGAFSHPVALWGGGEGRGAGDAAARGGGNVSSHAKRQPLEDDDGDRNNFRGGGPAEGTPWGRLAKWVGGGGEGRGRAAAIKKRASAQHQQSSPSSASSQWFAPRAGIGMASAVIASTKAGAYLPSSPPRSRSIAGRSKSVGRGRRKRRGDRSREKEKANQKPSTLMEELYKDLGELRRRLQTLQAGIDEKSDLYASVSRRYSRAMVEAEEAHELKLALSEQMLHLLLEQEQRMEGFLRDWVTFENGEGAGYLTQPPPLPLSIARKGSCDSGRAPSKSSCDSGGGGFSSDKTSPRSFSNDVGTGVSTRRGRSEKEGDDCRTPLCDGVKGEEEGDGFEKVESWMAAAGDAEEGEKEAGSLLVPFPSRCP